jgi:hypothetical protein
VLAGLRGCRQGQGQGQGSGRVAPAVSMAEFMNVVVSASISGISGSSGGSIRGSGDSRGSRSSGDRETENIHQLANTRPGGGTSGGTSRGSEGDPRRVGAGKGASVTESFPPSEASRVRWAPGPETHSAPSPPPLSAQLPQSSPCPPRTPVVAQVFFSHPREEAAGARGGRGSREAEAEAYAAGDVAEAPLPAALPRAPQRAGGERGAPEPASRERAELEPEAAMAGAGAGGDGAKPRSASPPPAADASSRGGLTFSRLPAAVAAAHSLPSPMAGVPMASASASASPGGVAARGAGPAPAIKANKLPLPEMFFGNTNASTLDLDLSNNSWKGGNNISVARISYPPFQGNISVGDSIDLSGLSAKVGSSSSNSSSRSSSRSSRRSSSRSRSSSN